MLPKRRDEDLDTIFKRICEDMVSGRLSAERFDKLSTEYEEEQRHVKQTIIELQTLIDSGTQKKIEIYYKAAGIIKIYTDDCIAEDGRKERWQKSKTA